MENSQIYAKVVQVVSLGFSLYEGHFVLLKWIKPTALPAIM